MSWRIECDEAYKDANHADARRQDTGQLKSTKQSLRSRTQSAPSVPARMAPGIALEALGDSTLPPAVSIRDRLRYGARSRRQTGIARSASISTHWQSASGGGLERSMRRRLRKRPRFESRKGHFKQLRPASRILPVATTRQRNHRYCFDDYARDNWRRWRPRSGDLRHVTRYALCVLLKLSIRREPELTRDGFCRTAALTKNLRVRLLTFRLYLRVQTVVSNCPHPPRRSSHTV